MRMKKRFKLIGSVLMAFVLLLSPLSYMCVNAADVTTEETVTDPIPDKTPKLVYGNPELPDEDAFVLLMLGDGFTADQQTKFFDESEKIADYVMATSPWDEFTDTVKIYALGVVSNESGAKADNAINQEEANLDTRDTYFGSAFWTSGMQRLLSISSEGRKKAEALAEQYLPHADYNVIIVNATTYGGSGGSVCVASLNNESLEMMLHELGHTASNLADEYFAGASYAREYANMTAESDPAKVRWARFIGKNGVGVYEYDNGGDGWYRPHQNCKMRFLGQQYAFCEVCKEQIRITFCRDSNVTKIFFQTYADMFYESATGKDMREYFIIRKNGKEAKGDTLGDSLKLTYKDSEGNVLEDIPSKAGTYSVTADFAGNEDFDACSLTAQYTIELPDLITLNVDSKVYDGEPAKLDYTVDYDDEYTVKAHYTGIIPYAAEITYDYESDEAPIKPGRYTVVLSAYDKETGAMISKKSKEYEITFKSTTISNNDTAEYPGAMPYYNNKTIVFSGEGFKADEQDKFEKIAKQYIDYFRNTEPFKEADIYFNYHTVETVSNESGIGSEPKDTYFKLSYDKNGKIVASEESTQGAMYIGNNVITSYYKANIVIVNDKKVKEGTMVTNKRFTVYSGMDEEDMEFAANELTNYFTGQPEGFRPSTEEEYDTERTQFLKALYYTWYGTDYAPIVSRAYDEKIVETGEPIDMSPYFHTYILGKETTDVSYKMSYYADDNGVAGEQLEKAPSEPGTYHAKAELILDEGKRNKTVELDGVTYKLPFARGWTKYTILSNEPEAKPFDGTVILGTTKYIYDGKIKKPTVTVKDSEGKKLTAGTDYEVTYPTGRKNVGRYGVKVTFIGKYTGKVTKYFTIVPKAVKDLKAIRYQYGNKVRVSWTKSTGATGYRIYRKKLNASSYTYLGATKNAYYENSGLTKNTSYRYKVIPYYKTSTGKTHYYSEKAYRTVLINTVKKGSKLVQVTKVKAAKSGTKVKVSWKNVGYETGYQISKSTSKTGTNIVATYKTTSGTSKAIIATKNKTYYYKVRAYRVVDGKTIFGAWSSPVKYTRK